jgi:hypothetical protein
MQHALGLAITVVGTAAIVILLVRFIRRGVADRRRDSADPAQARRRRQLDLAAVAGGLGLGVIRFGLVRGLGPVRRRTRGRRDDLDVRTTTAESTGGNE